MYVNCFPQLNLVPNPSFEDTIGACDVQMGISSPKYWQTNHIYSTPDYYNTCANSIIYPHVCTIPYSSRSYQFPRTGNAYVGIGVSAFTNPDSSQIDVEYISVKLKAPLKSNACYYAEFYANLGNISNATTNQISLLLTQNTFTTSRYSFTNTIQPQVQWDTTKYFTDTLNWVKISGQFVAKGGEEYLTIGNFKDGTHLKKIGVNSNFKPGYGTFILNFFTYILIDDVALYEIPSPQFPTPSFTMCPDADSLVLGDAPQLYSRYQWFANGIAIDTTSTIKVKPPQNTSYVLQSTQCTVNTQSIVITYSANCEPPKPLVIVEPIIPNVFTPNQDGINDVWEFNIGKGNILTKLMVYNRWGTDLSPAHSEGEGANATVRWDGRSTSGIECSTGIYFYMLQYTDVNGELHQKNGYMSLVK